MAQILSHTIQHCTHAGGGISLGFTSCVHGWWSVHVALIENLIHSAFLCVSVCGVPKMEPSTGLWVDSPLKRGAFICISSHGKKKTYRKKSK